MSYILYSNNSKVDHDLKQWNQRNLQGELYSFENRTVTRKFIEYTKNSKLKILEAGCGIGAWCTWFEFRGQNIIGVEYDSRIVHKAREINPMTPVRLGNVLQLDFPDNHFDIYVSLGVVEHFESGPQEVLTEANRVLKPGGFAFISTPYLNRLRKSITHPIRSLYFRLRRLVHKPFYFWEYRFTDNELKKYIEDSGFQVIETCIDDYEQGETDRHIGLWADWFFLRKKDGEMWALNWLGRLVYKFMKYFSPKIYCSGMLIVAKKK